MFFTRAVLEISAYYNAQNSVHFYTFLVQITALGFLLIEFSRINSILCTPLIVQRAG